MKFLKFFDRELTQSKKLVIPTLKKGCKNSPALSLTILSTSFKNLIFKNLY